MKYITIPVTHYQQNCSLIWCEKTGKAAAIDPGGDIEKILRALQENKLELEKILLTHGHLDHVGATAQLAKHFSVPIVGPHREDDFWLQALPMQAEMMGFGVADSFTPTSWLEEGDNVTVGELSLNVLHCPGHTPGHVVFFHPESRFAFVGDVIFRGSIGRSDFPRGNHDQLVSSIRSKLFPLGDDVEFQPGHGPRSTFGDEKRHNPFVADHRFG